MALARKNSFGTRQTLKVDGREYDIFALDALEQKGVGAIARLGAMALSTNKQNSVAGETAAGEPHEAAPHVLRQRW